MPDTDSAQALNERGQELKAAGDIAGAEAAYLAAVAAAPAWSIPAYNLGLLFKYEGRWQESLEWNQTAAALDPDDQAAWWNLGIAATALGRWADARKAWQRCGIDDPGGDDPPDYRFGRIPVRLDPEGDGEVVWANRLDPARARLISIPLPTSPFRWGDVVLNDGAAEGHRTVNGRQIPVFNVLERLVPSTIRTFVVELATSDRSAVDALEDIAHDMGGAAEHWGLTTRIMCRECSYGKPHEHVDSGERPAHHHCGLVAPSREIAQQVLDRWLASSDAADLVTWYEVEPAPAQDS
ncbi:MAG TPA: tetratricopeptide repeat protein [Vicinamibacterales bacterium]|nr:tetratricopeptide repeat protein [Vicinamibacterales bacterium]